MRFLILTVALCAVLSPISLLGWKPSTWSVDLAKYGHSAGSPEAAAAQDSEHALAAIDNYVAVALAVKRDDASPSHVQSRVKMSLLIFDAASGKLSAQCGPWTINSGFDVLPAANGGFLLHMTPLADSGRRQAETLLLLSPTCAQIKQIQLPQQGPLETSSWQPIESTTHHTLLLSREEKARVDYQLWVLDNLDVINQWLEPVSKTPMIVSVSDKGFLGLAHRPTTPTPDYYYRTFEGAWKPLPVSDCYSFLSNDILIGAKSSVPQPWKVNKLQVRAIRLDGTQVFSEMVSESGYHVEPMSGFSVSSDGDHFALSLDFEGAGWLWGNLDMGPGHLSAYVWSLSRAKPCAKIRLRRLFGSVLAFAPQGSWFALLDGSRLTVQPLPNHLQQ